MSEKKIRTKNNIILLLFCLLMTVACNRNASNENETNYLNEDVYPISQATSSFFIEEAYPIIDAESVDLDLPDSITIPEPNASMGIVFGKILTSNPENKPYVAPDLYLGAYISPNEGGENAPQLVGISPGIDPMAQQAQDGTFVFVDVPPGSYGLFIYTPMSAFLMTDAKTGEYVNVQVVAGQLIDLGTLYVK